VVMEARNHSGIRGRDAASLIWGRTRLNPRHSAYDSQHASTVLLRPCSFHTRFGTTKAGAHA